MTSPSPHQEERPGDRPIIFSGPMVQALLAGRKTQTRQILKLPKWASTDPSHIEFGESGAPEVICRDTGCLAVLPVPCASGDRLWVREAWHAARSLNRTAPRDISREADIEYAATARGYAEIGLKGRLRPSIHMPRWASRLTLIVESVRVERLQDISEEDAEAEGMREPYLGDGDAPFIECATMVSRRMQFRNLWKHLHGPDAWTKNPWVVAVGFRCIPANIDALPTTETPPEVRHG